MSGTNLKLTVAVAVFAWLLTDANIRNHLSNELKSLAHLYRTSAPSVAIHAPEAGLCGEEAGQHSHAVYTYALQAHQPALQILGDTNSTSVTSSDAAGSGVPLLELVLPLQGLQSYMPAVFASKNGLIHQLARTDVFLKNWALLDEHVQALQCGTKQRFAHPGWVMRTASAFSAQHPLRDNSGSNNNSNSSPAQELFEAAAAAVDCSNKQGLFRDAPASVLMFLPGQPYAAVADVMTVKSAQQQEAISLTLQLVEHPHMVSELEMHPHQSLDGHARHYHFHTPEGVVVDAARFMTALQQAGLAPAELHMFMKAALISCNSTSPPANVPNAEPWNCSTCDSCNCSTSCSSGFYLASGDLTSTCPGTDAAWPNVTGICSANNCTANPQAPANANAFNCGIATPGATCNTTCFDGYSVTSGTLESTCTVGNFTAVNGTCSPNPCNSSPTWPLNANATVNCTGTPSGSNCSTTCLSGFTQQGDLTAICTTGNFSSVAGQCINVTALNCTGQPSWPANSNNVTCSTTTAGATCNTTCVNGHTASGSLSSTCNSGSWTAVTGNCSANACTGQPSWPSNINPINCSGTLSGANCTATCTNGYTQSGALVATCSAGNFSTVGEVCNANPCTGQPSWPSNTASVNCSSTLSGSTCNNTCATNYTLFTGSLVATCTAGNFSAVIAECIPANQSVCLGQPSWPQNINTVNCSGTVTGSNCTTSCASGYTLTSGSLVSTCSLGAFSVVNATCSPKSCNGTNPPNQPNFAKPFNCPLTAHGATCNTTCISGYQLANGSLSSTCLLGNFSLVDGVCTPAGCNNTSPNSVQNQEPWNCSFVPSGGKCNTTCLAGFNLTAGSLTATCTNGSWSSVQATCFPIGNCSSTQLSLTSAPQSVCAGPSQLSAVYTFTAKEVQGSTTFNPRVTNANGVVTGACTTNPATLSGPQPDGTNVTVLCNSNATNAKFPPGNQRISLSATYSGANGCPNSTTPSISATTNVRPLFRMSLGAVKTTPACASTDSLTDASLVAKFNYNVFPNAGINASDMTLTATSSAAVVGSPAVPVTCTTTRTVTKLDFNVTRGQLIVNCTGAITQATNISITAVLSASEPGCDRPRTLTSISLGIFSCCRTDYSYLQPAGSVAQPDPLCMNCANTSKAASGWTPAPYRTGPIDKHDMVAGPMSEASCSMPQGYVVTGSVSMKCLDDYTMSFSLTTLKYSQIKILRLMVTCNIAGWLTPCNHWRTVPLRNTTVVSDAQFSYRSWTFRIPNWRPVREGKPWCLCPQIAWGVAQKANYVGVDCDLKQGVAASMLP